MNSSSLRRKAAVLLIGMVLAAPLVSAASPRALPTQHTTGLLEAVRTHLWSTLTAMAGENGCYIDPFGGCTGTTAAPPVTPDNGCSADPFGGCAGAGGAASPGEIMDAGCSLDPYGRCLGGS